jgi:hypothetical protein
MRRQLFTPLPRAGDKAGNCRRLTAQHAARFITLQRHRHWPGGFPGGDDRELAIRECLQGAAGYRRADEMRGGDALNARTKNVVQVGAKSGKEFGQ